MPIQVVAQRRIAVSGRWVEAPLQHVAGEEMGVWDDAVALTLTLGADVDQHRARGYRVACL